MSEIIKFEFDRPVEVALKFAEPKIFASQFPGGDDRHMYSTTDGRVMYVNPLTAARIAALKLSPGEVFFVCKRKNGRLTEYDVFRESEAPALPAPTAAPASNGNAPANGFVSQHKNGRRTAFEVLPEAPAPASAPVVNWGGHAKRFPAVKSNLPERLYAGPAGPTLEEQLRASVDLVARRQALGEQGNGTLAVMAPPRSDPQTAPATASATAGHSTAARIAPAVAEFSSRLVLETTALVDCYATVLETASKKHGNAIKPEDVRSLLVTAYINASKGGNRAA